MVRRVSSVTYPVETQKTFKHVHVDHLRSRSCPQYAGSNIATEALRRPSTGDSAGHWVAPTTLQLAHQEADTAEHLPNDTTKVFPQPTGEQEWSLPVAHDELLLTLAEEPSDSSPAVRGSQRTWKEPYLYVYHDFRHFRSLKKTTGG